jgi:hypothetical protein
MPAELGRLFQFTTILIPTYTNFRRVDFLGSLFTVALYVCQSVHPHDIEHVAVRELITDFHKNFDKGIF